VLAASAVVAGAAFVLAPREQTVDFSFVGDSEQTFVSDQIVLMDVAARAGYLLIAAGLLALAFWLGYRLGLHDIGHRVEKNV
jgi:FtsZ-interacting cell division protein ZipA